MKQWIDRTQELLNLATEAEGNLYWITKLISEEDSILGLLWDGIVSQSMPDGLTLDRIKESLSSFRDELTDHLETMKKNVDVR